MTATMPLASASQPMPAASPAADDDQRRGLGRRVDVHAARGHVARDDERDGSRRQHDREAGEVQRDEPARQAGDAAEQRERADAAEPRARPARVPGPLAFDADGGAAKGRDDDAKSESVRRESNGGPRFRSRSTVTRFVRGQVREIRTCLGPLTWDLSDLSGPLGPG